MTATAEKSGPAEPDDGPRAGLATTSDGAPVPTAWQRARHRIERSTGTGWAASLGITFLAFLLRLWHLSTPKVFEFDETYYAKDAWSLLHYGYARAWLDNADASVLAGHVTAKLGTGPEMIVHPDVGKWIIAIGIKLFGMNTFGWRISSVVVGSLLVLLTIRFVRRVSGSMLLGLVGGILVTFDGLAFVLSRLALLDLYVAFFLLLAVHLMVVDRDWCRRRFARLTPTQLDGRAWGPIGRMLFRPWLLASGVAWGLAIGSKWEAAYALAAFGVLYVAWSGGMRRSFGVRLAVLKSILADGLSAFVHLVVVAVMVYVATWIPWMAHAHVYEQSLSSTQYTRYTGHGHCDKTSYVPDDESDRTWPTATEKDAHGLGEVVQSLRSLWYYHHDVYTFHTHFLQCSTHTYASNPAGWLLLNRPVGVAATTGIKPGEGSDGQICTATPSVDPDGTGPAEQGSCLRQVLLLGTPVLWWGGCVALLAALVLWIGRRDWRFGVAVLGVASTWLPWLQYAGRPIFSYYMIDALPFLVLAICLCLGKLLDGPQQGRRLVGAAVGGAFVVLVILNFAWFWPIYTNQLLTRQEWLMRIWFQRWI
ncbi:MAG: phospholipid carrier-dependent glycosyltransferase, partial [Nocardioides sp.]|nr:phospholipid carrier-dependent glycosyltransferase [Nocardioides sp.]